jgi:hypothetical protein
MSLDSLRYWLSQDHLFIYDEAATRSYKQLRALPAMAYLGFSAFTYPKSWSQLSGTEMFMLYEHTHTNIRNIDTVTEPLCVITNQGYEEYTPDTIAKLRNIPRENEGRVAILADEKQFQIQGAKRPLRDQHNVTTRQYRGIFETFEDHYQEAGYTMPLNDTMNLFIQDNAILYREISGEPVTSTEDLFEALDEAPYLPLYGSMCRVFNRDESYGASPLSAEEIDDFADWLRRRIEWDNKTANRVTESLNKRVLEENATFADATRVDHPKNTNARTFREKLDPDSHSLQKRFHTWLGEVLR